ncbi:hypothetical protein J25TS5_12530 [Paenibacillus faecis]|nr:hypothetical protein J25TS5_12530 [Paenibacillus faecis]
MVKNLVAPPLGACVPPASRANAVSPRSIDGQAADGGPGGIVLGSA